jgi:hypothetical protein
MNDKGNIKMTDQFRSRGFVKEETYRNQNGKKGVYISNDASNYRIVLWDDMHEQGHCKR